jgi:hypothetical protein
VRNLFQTAITVSVVLLVVFCFPVDTARADGPYRGKVIDAETKAPIEGAVVLGVWRRQPALALHPGYFFEEAKEVLTDKDGEFTLPGHFSMKSILSPLSEVDLRIYIYKPGYGSFPRYQTFPNPKQSYEDLFRPFKTHGLVELLKLQTREERLQVVREACPSGDIPDGKLPHLIKAMNIDWVALGREPSRGCFNPSLGDLK